MQIKTKKESKCLTYSNFFFFLLIIIVWFLKYSYGCYLSNENRNFNISLFAISFNELKYQLSFSTLLSSRALKLTFFSPSTITFLIFFVFPPLLKNAPYYKKSWLKKRFSWWFFYNIISYYILLFVISFYSIIFHLMRIIYDSFHFLFWSFLFLMSRH